MKAIYFFIPLVLISCQPSAHQQEEEPESIVSAVHFDWLLGKWQRTNDAEGRKTYETWKKETPTSYRGLGYTMSEGDTTFKENLQLVQRKERWQFEVRGVNPGVTIFPLTDITDSSFICTNFDNEFPKNIEYRKRPEGLMATIADSSLLDSTQRIEFPFIPLAP